MKKMLVVVVVAFMLASPLAWSDPIRIPSVQSQLVKWEYETVGDVYEGVQSREGQLMLVFAPYRGADGSTLSQIHYLRHPELKWSEDFRRLYFRNTLCATRHWYGMRHRGCKLTGETTPDGFVGEFTE